MKVGIKIRAKKVLPAVRKILICSQKKSHLQSPLKVLSKCNHLLFPLPANLFQYLPIQNRALSALM